MKKTIKLNDLLYKIANDEDIPKSVKFEDNVYYYRPEMEDYYCKEECEWLFCYTVARLKNYDFEIIEEDEKPNEIKKIMCIDTRETRDCIIRFQDTINELTEAVNYLLKKLEVENEKD